VWPVVFLLLALPKGPLTHSTRMVAVLVLIIGLSLTWCIVETTQDSVWAFFSPLTRAWELALGALIAVVTPHLRGRAPRIGLVAGLLGLGVLLVCTWTYSSSTLWPGAAVIAPAVATGAIIAGGSLRGADGFGGFVRFAPIQWLGDTSYSLYLVHWPVIAIATEFAVAPLPLHSRLELVALSLALAAIMFYAVENPIRRSARLVRGRLLTFAMGALLIGCSYAAIFWHLSHY